MTKKKTDSEIIKSINEKYTFIIAGNIFLLVICIMVLLSNTIDMSNEHINYDLLNENYKLKYNLSNLEYKYEFLQNENLELWNIVNNINTTIKEDPIKLNSNDVREIECLANSYLWNYDIQEYVPSEEYILTNCYEVLK